jgi:multimeric flavodoxin WrbA
MGYKILGISASLRNARRGRGNEKLIEDLSTISSEEALVEYLETQAKIHLENFVEAGRKEGVPFDQMYTNLKKLKGERGLSNSEVMLSAALWSAKEIGAEIDHTSLSEYFMETSKRKNIDEFIEKIRSCDAIILSTPVYFGDRSSLSQSFINFLRSNPELKAEMEGKVYAGLSVGAKRNGGQETALIYQLVDMINLGLLGVGNDSETTSQYGGTGVAGDVGTMSKDDYGLKTAMGTGRRVSRVARMLYEARQHKLNGKHRVAFWILQDKDEVALESVKSLIAGYGDQLEAKIIDFTDKNIIRCLACDICPTDIDVDEVYRCIIKSKNDSLMEMHEDLLNADAIIPVAYSAVDRVDLKSNYQRLMERTRYFRRGDYVFSDLLTAPLIIDEIGSNENLQIRMVTSMMRHHTVVARPMIQYRYQGNVINEQDVQEEFNNFNAQVRTLIKAKLLAYSSGVNHLRYSPVGYVLSAVKDVEDQKLLKRHEMIHSRIEQTKVQSEERVSKSTD